MSKKKLKDIYILEKNNNEISSSTHLIIICLIISSFGERKNDAAVQDERLLIKTNLQVSTFESSIESSKANTSALLCFSLNLL